MIKQQSISHKTRGRDTYDITHLVSAIVRESGISIGMVNIFVHHTSCSLILCENADPAVRTDLESFMGKITPDGDPMYLHRDEGVDDMSAHVRTVLTESSLTIPIANRGMLLGTWQGIYLWEHRTQSHSRHLTVTVYGE